MKRVARIGSMRFGGIRGRVFAQCLSRQSTAGRVRPNHAPWLALIDGRMDEGETLKPKRVRNGWRRRLCSDCRP